MAPITGVTYPTTWDMLQNRIAYSCTPSIRTVQYSMAKKVWGTVDDDLSPA